MHEVRGCPDIMGEFRPEVEAFYKRDEKVIIEERNLVMRLFFSDLAFTRNLRVTQVRWHPTLSGIAAMSVVENVAYEEYLDHLSKRLAMPNVISIWSMTHPFFPQVSLVHSQRNSL